MKLDREIGEVNRRYWEDEQQASRNKSVVLVEGDDDREILEEVFRQRSRSWANRIRVVVAGGRNRVLQKLDSFPGALGLVDRDTWTDDEVSRERAQDNRLYVTEGWCLENIFLQPGFTQRYDPRVTGELSKHRERWIQCGALWWTLQRTREAQQLWQESIGWSGTYGAPREDLKLDSAADLKDSLHRRIPADILEKARFDIEAIVERFAQRLAEVRALSEAEQWQRGVHGKSAFNRLLVPALQRFPGQYERREQHDWRSALAGDVGKPAPLDALMALLFP